MILKNIPDEVAKNLENCKVEIYEDAYKITGKKSTLYDVILELSFHYDLEIV